MAIIGERFKAEGKLESSNSLQPPFGGQAKAILAEFKDRMQHELDKIWQRKLGFSEWGDATAAGMATSS